MTATRSSPASAARRCFRRREQLVLAHGDSVPGAWSAGPGQHAHASPATAAPRVYAVRRP
jgi:hypothetical protein